MTAIGKSNPSVLLITGDVTDYGEQRAWEIFWEEIDRNGLENKAWVVPGNHDVCVLGIRRRLKSRI